MTPIDAYSCTLFMWWEQKVWDKDTYKNIISSSHKDVKEDFRIELIVIIMKQDMEGRVDFSKLYDWSQHQFKLYHTQTVKLPNSIHGLTWLTLSAPGIDKSFTN